MLSRLLDATCAVLRRRSSTPRPLASGMRQVGGTALGGAMQPSAVLSAAVSAAHFTSIFAASCSQWTINHVSFGSSRPYERLCFQRAQVPPPLV
jgi:hypothetical protein